MGLHGIKLKKKAESDMYEPKREVVLTKITKYDEHWSVSFTVKTTPLDKEYFDPGLALDYTDFRCKFYDTNLVLFTKICKDDVEYQEDLFRKLQEKFYRAEQMALYVLGLRRN